jgi:hypothetical protein
LNTEDQSETIHFLEALARERAGAVERIDTHGAHIFVAGDEAWKLKRAVRYPFMDLGDVDRRRDCCNAEVELNRRTAPSLYRGVGAVTRGPSGKLALDGEGAVVDWIVRMRSFDQSGLLDRLADAGKLEVEVMIGLAETIARFHAAARPRPDKGGAEAMRWIVDDNVAEFRELAALAPARRVSALEAASADQLARVGALLDARRAAGWVRHCHGDLHLRNVVMIDGRPTLFDCIEFNDDIACVDVLYDLAFLLMDLWKRGLEAHANAVLNRYLVHADHRAALALLPLFLSARASVRAKVTALEAADRTGRKLGAAKDEVDAYLKLAAGFAAPPSPQLIAVGGLSGSGKTTLAHALAPDLGAAPGAVVVRSDVERKRICGAALDGRLPPSAYEPEVSRRVYGVLLDVASSCLAQGHAVVLDAVYDRPADRAAVERVAADLGLPFTGFWLDAPVGVLSARVDARTGDASDADSAVVRRQLAHDPGPIRWHRIEASGAREDVAATARRSLTQVLA